jgi:hypothetical protein
MGGAQESVIATFNEVNKGSNMNLREKLNVPHMNLLSGCWTKGLKRKVISVYRNGKKVKIKKPCKR